MVVVQFNDAEQLAANGEGLDHNGTYLETHRTKIFTAESVTLWLAGADFLQGLHGDDAEVV